MLEERIDYISIGKKRLAAILSPKSLGILITPGCIDFIFTTVLYIDQFYGTPSLAPAEKANIFKGHIEQSVATLKRRRT